MTASSSPNLPERPRRVVYTCLFGSSEQFNDFSYPTDGVDFICFTDDPDLKSEFWTMRFVAPSLLDPARVAKQIKILSHRYLPEYDWSLYIDNTVLLKVPPLELFDKILAHAGCAFVCFRHYARNCVYDEAERVISLEYDDPARIQSQMKAYRHVGYPPNNGLAALPFILRKHHDAALSPIMEAWYQQVLLFSLRDQLSFNPVAWFHKLRFGYINMNFQDMQLLQWPMIRGGIRVPRDFDDARYVLLNPDVVANPRRHYLNQGAIEGRRYK